MTGEPTRHLRTAAWAMAALFVADRSLKAAAVAHFFRRPEPAGPPPGAVWPRVTLLQPITRGASNLPAALACRAALDYAGPLQHILICDGGDDASLANCRQWLAAHPALDAKLVGIRVPRTAVATKVEKLRAGLHYAAGEVLCFVDDDINLRSDGVTGLVRHLNQPGVGAVFGLACYTGWSNRWSSLMSAFVNANALLNYIPLAYLTEPYTITGHFYALRRATFEEIGGLEGLEGRIDDDHELARRVRGAGLRCVQSAVVYDVENYLDSWAAYANQMRRWFIIPKQTMLPYLSAQEQAITLLAGSANLLLPLLAGLAVVARGARRPLVAALAVYAAVYQLGVWRHLQRQTPWRRWPWVLIAGLIAPLQAVTAVLGGDTFVWRGRRVRLQRWGKIDVLGEP